MKCPICKGDGGWKEVILDDGTGPWYECCYCKETGEVTRSDYMKYIWAVRKEKKFLKGKK